MITYTDVKWLTLNTTTRNGKPVRFYAVKHDNFRGGATSKTFNTKTYKSKESAYEAALAFHKSCYPFYKYE